MVDSGALERVDRGPREFSRLVDPALFHGPRLDRTWQFLRLDFTGIAFATLFFCWSLTPSLLPRDWLFQGLIGGINAAIGYTVGTAIGWAVRRYFLRNRSWWPLPEPWSTGLRVLVTVTSVVVSLVMLAYSAAWQRELAALMGAEGTTTTGYIRTGGLSLLVGAAIISAYRLLRELVRWIAARLIRRWHLAIPTATTVGILIVTVLFFLLVDGVLMRGIYAATNAAFSLQNSTTRDGAEQPLDLEKSGSPDSLAPWDSLGYEGRNFVSRGLDAGELTAANGTPAKDPIRVYAGLETAEDTDARMDVVIGELERTGAFSRKVLVVIPTTGTGWVNPTAAQAIELVHNGDTALVASQYSFLPSWISFLADREKAAEAGKELIDRVHERWLQEPEATRPKLLVYGESLGTRAGEGAFDTLSDIRQTVDGVLWVGPPNSNRLWGQLIQRRDLGTPEVDPEYAAGLVVRFADDSADMVEDTGEWLSPRILYVQHPSDPVVWWSPDLAFTRPDWLTEPPGDDRSPSMKWFPFVTFWQVSADLTNAAGVPDGHGHNYGTLVLDGWITVAQPEGWTAVDTERVRSTLESLSGTEGPEK
ncbi:MULTISPECIES: alpha/beta-hydrolase family protein [unclassified Rhodococcus (in: high G+C Gram-positive bacteria)]|uniref:alpha/beta hydrolase n=1 Tax=unclassified Rhodococcus (in: high G+C Gram-positive bacteria) TaxID=192944 RepID=UPI00163A9DB4|nr:MULTISPECIES: alpha/beta hydrolase [unclassified Rhodococcus (in: high G+C Gram-positive bacteria)]MBC2639870.1 alpha/beta-hydrolase family protein [Rhodococcus sp. 3A]MBC2895384.1 alpha/beta-hydrolase family protein [Rhodococcus sp. 4CII]